MLATVQSVNRDRSSQLPIRILNGYAGLGSPNPSTERNQKADMLDV